MVVEYEQVGAVVHRCRWMCVDYVAAHLPALTVVVWVHYAERGASLACIGGIGLEFGVARSERYDDNLALTLSVDIPTRVFTVAHKVGNLNGASLSDAEAGKSIVKRLAALL